MDVQELCQRYGYPNALHQVLDELVEAARSEIPGLRALVLSGSVATGDFVWRTGPSGEDARLLSDIDVLAFAERGGPRPGFSTSVARLERRSASPLFHIDVAISPVSALRRLPRRYQFVEAGIAGAAPIGPDVLESFPDRFDAGEARQSFVGNTWKGVESWVATDGDDETYRLALARMLLDLPILAFAEENRCLPGHATRADAFAKLGDGHPLARPELKRAVALAVEMRRTGDVPRSELEPHAWPVLTAGFHFLDRAGPPEPADAALARRIHALLPPRSARRLAGELRAALRDRSLWHRDPGWWLRRKEAVGGAALIGLLRFAIDGAQGAPPPPVTALLRAFSAGREPTGEGPHYLESARRVYWEGRCRLYPSDAAKAAASGSKRVSEDAA